jgi:hypothetical protein
MPNLQIMIINNQSHEPRQQCLALPFRKAIDVLHMVAEREDGFPACDGVGADYGVDGFEDFADVLGGSAGSGVDFESVLFGGFVEAWLGVGCC